MCDISNMSFLEHLPALTTPLKEFRKIQEIRKKAKMNAGNIVVAEATVITAFRTEESFVQQTQAPVCLENLENGKQQLRCGLLALPLELILYNSCINNTATVQIKEDEHFPFKKISFEFPSIHDIDNFISKLKLPQKPRPNALEHDGNVTSSSADSDSGPSGTGGVNNSFESDDPSATEDD